MKTKHEIFKIIEDYQYKLQKIKEELNKFHINMKLIRERLKMPHLN